MPMSPNYKACSKSLNMVIYTHIHENIHHPRSSYIMHQCFERSQSLKLKPVGHDFPEATIQDSMLDSLLQQAQLTCDHSEVRSLFLTSVRGYLVA